ncbi:MAG: HD domain-containing protein [bacterium]
MIRATEYTGERVIMIPSDNTIIKKIVNFLFETGMLKKTPRTGYQFLGSGKESVAEHTFRVACIGYALSRITSQPVDEMRLFKMCLFHDLPEARTGDHNYVNKKYVTIDEEKAIRDLTGPLPFGNEIAELIREFTGRVTFESKLANDADQLDFLLQLKEYGDLGNKYTRDWSQAVLKRLETGEAEKLARQILETDSSAWWFQDKMDAWWINGGKERRG